MDVANSLYHQNKNYNEPDLVPEKFINNFLNPKNKNKGYFNFHKDWFFNRHNHQILYVKYEDIIKNIDLVITQVAKFINVTLNDEIFLRTKEKCSFEFMKSHESKFGDQPEKKKKVYDQFIRKGKIGDGNTLFSDEQKGIFKDKIIELEKLENKIF